MQNNMKPSPINKDEFEIINALKSLTLSQKQSIIKEMRHTKADEIRKEEEAAALKKQC